MVLSTTNGTPALLSAVSRADVVLVGALLNLRSLVEAIPAGSELTVICAGTGGRFALEDAYAAGRIVARWRGRAPMPRARRSGSRTRTRLARALAESADAAALRATGQADDIAFCARESVSSIVPRGARGPRRRHAWCRLKFR